MAAFKNLIVLFFLTLVTNAFAARISYVAGYKQGMGGKPQRTTYAGNIADDHEQTVISNMHSWSGGKYTAAKSRIGIITVSAVQQVDTKTQASGEVQAMIALVCAKLKECSPTTPQ